MAGAHHLLRVSVPPQWAVKLMNRATADNQSAQAEEEGLEPTKEWVKDLVDEVIADEFGSPDLELAWLDEDTGAAQAEARLEARVKIGAATLNELRDALGLEAFQNPAADRPMVLTATGYVPIEAGAGGAGTTPGGKGQSPSSVSDRAVVAKASVDDPEHPGWPAGTPDGKGGQFRPKDNDGTEVSSAASENLTEGRSSPDAQYAARETGTRIDAGEVSPAASRESAVQVAAAVPPEAYIQALTGDSQIDEVTKKLTQILQDTIDRLERIRGQPQRFGIIVHLAFAEAVIAAGIRGISPLDVEHPFILPSDFRGNKNFVIPDVVLRNEVGDIVAIYDVKTGQEGLRPNRIAELRAATKARDNVYFIELSTVRGALRKVQEVYAELFLRK